MTDIARLHEALDSSRPLTWVMTGDSITHGLIHTRGERNYVDHLHEVIRGDLARVQDAVINTAISGWRVRLILDDFDQRVARWRPDVVTLMIGTNDCSTVWLDPIILPTEFAEDLESFVARVRALGAIPVLQTPPVADLAHAPDRERLSEFAAAMREVAASERAMLVDQHAYFAGFSDGTGPGNEGVPWGLLDDAFHPNAAGHAAMALQIVRALDLFRGGREPSTMAHLAARTELARHPQWPPRA